MVEESHENVVNLLSRIDILLQVGDYLITGDTLDSSKFDILKAIL